MFKDSWTYLTMIGGMKVELERLGVATQTFDGLREMLRKMMKTEPSKKLAC